MRAVLESRHETSNVLKSSKKKLARLFYAHHLQLKYYVSKMGGRGLWVLNEIILKIHTESLKKNVGAVWELLPKQHSQSSPFPPKFGWIGCAIQQATPNSSHDFLQTFSMFFQGYFIKNPQTTIALPSLTHNISAIGDVNQKV